MYNVHAAILKSAAYIYNSITIQWNKSAKYIENKSVASWKEKEKEKKNGLFNMVCLISGSYDILKIC